MKIVGELVTDYWNSVLDLPNVKDNPMRYNLTS